MNDSSVSASYYERRVFFCLNQHHDGRASCADFGAQQAFDHCKQRVKAAGLADAGKVRVNKAGCLDRCAAGRAGHGDLSRSHSPIWTWPTLMRSSSPTL